MVPLYPVLPTAKTHFCIVLTGLLLTSLCEYRYLTAGTILISSIRPGPRLS